MSAGRLLVSTLQRSGSQVALTQLVSRAESAPSQAVWVEPAIRADWLSAYSSVVGTTSQVQVETPEGSEFSQVCSSVFRIP